MEQLKEIALIIGISLSLLPFNQVNTQPVESIESRDVTFQSEGVLLAGTIFKPKVPHAALVIVHGSDQVPRLTEFGKLLSKNGILVLTYDKRGIGESGGVYAGPEVGTNNISSANLHLLANDASAAVNTLHKENNDIPIGLVGFSQAGWIIPITANKNHLVEFMVLFSCPTITTLEQLRFQFYTDGNTEFWDHHTEEEAREHIKNDPDRYQFAATDPKVELQTLSTPGLWIFGEQDIQIPVKLGIEHLNSFKAKGKPFDYCLFPELGHNTAFADTTVPVDIVLEWIKREVKKL